MIPMEHDMSQIEDQQSHGNPLWLYSSMLVSARRGRWSVLIGFPGVSTRGACRFYRGAGPGCPITSGTPDIYIGPELMT